VITGIAAIPLLLAKLWTVYSKLWTWPPVRSVAHAVERISLVPLVGGAVFQLATGFFNALQWYPWDFYFPAAHYQGAWIAIGALVVHAGAKTAVVRSSLRRAEPDPSPPDALSRRGFLGAAFGTAGLLVLVTAGQTVRPLRRFGLLATQKPDVGPQGFPVNKTAREVRVLDLALDPSYRLVVRGRVRRRLALSLDDLRAMPQREAVLPIACVEGWSADARWRGVRVRDVLERAGADEGAEIFVESLQPRGIYRTSILEGGLVADPDTLLALEVNGEPLHPDHGYPCRLIAPNRPGVMQTKWVGRLIVG
jgi:DMSO/TMAO reductase YedYZ molybdopterin-dependent catalytic subunit